MSTTSLRTCIILAGGRSSRFGEDKRRLRLWGAAGPALLERVVETAAALCDETIVVLNDPEAWGNLPATLVADRVPGAGPLGGLASGLAAARGGGALLLAADLPLLQPELLRAMLQLPDGYDALVPLRPHPDVGPRNPLAAEPLLAAYRASCLPAVEACLARGERQMTAPLSQLRVRYLRPDEWRRHDPQGRSFLNVNSPGDVAELRRRGLLAG